MNHHWPVYLFAQAARPSCQRGKGITIWLVAILASITLHGLLLSWRWTMTVSPIQEKSRVTKISFRKEIPPRPAPPVPPPPLKPPTPPKEVPEPIVKPIPKPVVRKKPEPVVKPKPIVAQRPVVREPLPEPKVSSVPPPTASVNKTAVVPAVSPPTAPPVDEEQPRQQYLQLLFSHIEIHKYYPNSARRRRLEGEVLVSFTLLADGGINDLRVTDGPSLLQEAASQSVQQSLPLPIPQGGVALPLNIVFRMQFHLR